MWNHTHPIFDCLALPKHIVPSHPSNGIAGDFGIGRQSEEMVYIYKKIWNQQEPGLNSNCCRIVPDGVSCYLITFFHNPLLHMAYAICKDRFIDEARSFTIHCTWHMPYVRTPIFVWAILHTTIAYDWILWGLRYIVLASFFWVDRVCSLYL